MMQYPVWFLALFSVPLAACSSASQQPSVSLSHGCVFGFINESYAPNVEQYLGIPYAVPPLGSLRFLPPLSKNVIGDFNATIRQPSCSQWLTKLPSIVDLTPEFVPPTPYGEDCLYLNVFTPRKKRSSRHALPVVVWYHGGVLIWGGTNTPGEFPVRWIERSQDHIMVQVNYRLNVFGYPNARGLSDDQQNAGVKDARLALEWVRDNIHHFGGNPDHIIMQGQSAGSAMVDILEYGYTSEPIAKGAIHQSAVASILNATASDPDHQHIAFTMLAQHLNCSTQTAEQELDCMQNVDQQHIETFLQEYNDAMKMPVINFAPIADNRLVFTPLQYVQKYATSKMPIILGFNSQEGSTFVPYTSAQNPGATAKLIHDLTLWEVQCAVVTAARQRYAGGAKTFFYFYSGNFTNISPEPWMGAYHFAELPLIFGSHEDLSPPSPQIQYDVSHKMQDYWLAFIKDPHDGPRHAGWPLYAPSGSLLHIAPHDTDRAVELNLASSVDNACMTTP